MSLPGYQIIDLSHVISESMFHWPGDPLTRIENSHPFSPGNGFSLNTLHIGEHSGTHAGTGRHFIPEGQTADAVPAERLICPIVSIHVGNKVAADRDYAVTVEDIQAWEEKYSPIPEGSIVLLDTGWSRFWGNPDKYYPNGANNPADNHRHYPGFTAEAAHFLLNMRKVVGLGTDSPGVDPGIETAYPVGKLLSEREALHLENLRNLDRLPSTGGLIFVGMLAIKGGSGSPARILALIPQNEFQVSDY